MKSANYKTVPAADTKELKIAAGGDLGLSSNGDLMASYLVEFKPDIIVLGGDIAYDDAMRSCYYSWDTVYYMFEPIYEKLDRLVPLIFSVGNHDVGFDALSTLDIQRTN
jgi:predicted MPP superfamily phosphohydrolase